MMARFAYQVEARPHLRPPDQSCRDAEPGLGATHLAPLPRWWRGMNEDSFTLEGEVEGVHVRAWKILAIFDTKVSVLQGRYSSFTSPSHSIAMPRWTDWDAGHPFSWTSMARRASSRFPMGTLTV